MRYFVCVFTVKENYGGHFIPLRQSKGVYSVNSLFVKHKSPVCHIILGHTGIGATFRSTMFNSLYLFTCKLYGKSQRAN